MLPRVAVEEGQAEPLRLGLLVIDSLSATGASPSGNVFAPPPRLVLRTAELTTMTFVMGRLLPDAVERPLAGFRYELAAQQV
jgi:hypothetical protein